MILTEGNTVTAINSVDDILKWEQDHAKLKASAILRLLKEREDLEASTEARLKLIKAELAALGYKIPRPRKPKP